MRTENKKLQDAQINHTVIKGDISSIKTYEDCISRLGGEKVDLIIERMIGGKTNLPQDPLVLSKIFARWYRLLNEKGLMFMEYNYRMFGSGREIEQLKKYIETNYQNKLEFQSTGGCFRLTKLADASLSLPFPKS